MVLRLSSILPLCACLLLFGACPGSSDIDQTTPEATLRSFAHALAKGDIPERLADFINEPRELRRWQLLCRENACRHGTFTIVRTQTSGATATVFARYHVGDKNGGKVIGSPANAENGTAIRLRRSDGKWKIEQFGERIVGKPSSPPTPNAHGN